MEDFEFAVTENANESVVLEVDEWPNRSEAGATNDGLMGGLVNTLLEFAS